MQRLYIANDSNRNVEVRQNNSSTTHICNICVDMQINVKNFKEGVLRFLTTEVRIEEIGIILKLFNIEFLQTPKSVGTQVKILDLDFH